MATNLLDRIRRAKSAPLPSTLVAPDLFGPATAPAPARHTSAPEALDTFERALAAGASLDSRRRAQGRAPGYAVSAPAPSGSRVHVAPSRFREGLFYVLVSADAPPYTPLEGREMEEHVGIMATRARLARGGLDPDAAAWRADVADWDDSPDGARVTPGAA